MRMAETMMHKRQSSDISPTSALRATNACTHCGCTCNGRYDTRCSLDLQQHIEELQSQLLRSHAHISSVELEFQGRQQASEYEIFKLRDELVKLRDRYESVELEFQGRQQASEYEIFKLRDELVKLRDRYERLMESHKRMQKINDGLENKLLKVVNASETDKTDLQKEVASLTSRLIDTKAIVCELEEENERFRTDCNLAVQLLHCKPSNFVAQRLDGLPLSLQDRVKAQLSSEELINMENSGRESAKLIHVPMQTFPPTAMVFSVPKSEKESAKDSVNGSCKTAQTVPMSMIANVLTPTEMKRKPQRTYICVKCKDDYVFVHKETQTGGWKEGGKEVTLRVHRKIRNQLSSSSTEADL